MLGRLANFGLQARFVVLALAAALPALAAIAYYTIADFIRSAEDAEVRLTELADIVASRQRAMVEEAGSVLSLLSRSREILPDDPVQCSEYLRRLQRSEVINPQTLSMVSVVDLDGNVYCSTGTMDQPINVADRRYFQEVQETRELTFGEALTGRASGQATLPVAYPVVDDEERVVAALVASLNLPAVAQSALPDLGEGAVVTLITGDGLVLGRHPDPEGWSGSRLVEEPLVRTLSEQPTGVTLLAGLDEVERLYAIRRSPIGNSDLFATVGFGTDQVYAAANRTVVIGAVITLVAALGAILLGLVLGRGLVSRSVRLLAQAAARIAAGDLTVRVARPMRNDEFASLTDSFNGMAEALAQREGALAESEQRYRQVVDLIPAAIWIHAAGRITFVNAYAVSLFGAGGPEDLVGREILSMIHPDDLPRARARTRDVVEAGTVLPREELRFQRLDGSTIIVEAQAVRFRRGDELHVLSTGRDVTAQRATEEQLRQSQKLEGIGRLTGGVAHDFNNLLTVIIGNLEFALDYAEGDQRTTLENAILAAERGATLTQRLLAFSRQQALVPEPLDLNRLIAGMEDMLRRSVGEDIEIVVRLDPALSHALVDKGQLETALLNLAVNARDAMPEGGKLTIETANIHLDESYAEINPEVVPGDYAMLSVADTGTGMPPEVAQRATEPFFTTKEVGKGTGLGLSMVYGFMKQSQGHMKIYSELGVGTSVRLYLPRIGAATDAREQTPPAAIERGSGETILVVEDEAPLRAMVLRHLEDLGYRVLTAANGVEAREILRSDEEIDLLFTDVVMPGGINGRQVAEEAVRLRPSLRVLYTSGYAETAIIHHGRLDPGVHLLSKPFKKQDLARRVRELLHPPTMAEG